MAKIVVTGAGGYVGGRLLPILERAGWQIHGLVREPEPRLQIAQTLCDLRSPGSYDIVAAACDGADAVIHLAGENEVVAASRPAAALAGTVTATERVAEACAATGVRRLIYTSTMHVYALGSLPGQRCRRRCAQNRVRCTRSRDWPPSTSPRRAPPAHTSCSCCG